MKKIFLFVLLSTLSLYSFCQAPIEITFEGFDEDPTFVEADTAYSRRDNSLIITPANWLVKLNHDTYRFSFNFYGLAESLVGTYTIDASDFLLDYTYGYDKQVKPYAQKINFKTCILTITETHPTTNITRYVLEADILSTDDVHYLVHATHDILTPTEALEGEILDAQITPTNEGFVLLANSQELDLDILLSFKWDHGILGHFSNYQLDTENTTIQHNGQTFLPNELVLDIEYRDELSSGKDGYLIPALQFITPDIKSVSLMIEAPIIPIDTVDITCYDFSQDASQAAESGIMFEASNTEYAITGIYKAGKIQVGVYNGDNVAITITELATTKEITAYRNQLTLSNNGLKGYIAEIELLGTDHNLYYLHLSKGQAPSTAVDNMSIQTRTTKHVENGQLYILKNGVKYNILGAQVK